MLNGWRDNQVRFRVLNNFSEGEVHSFGLARRKLLGNHAYRPVRMDVWGKGSLLAVNRG